MRNIADALTFFRFPAAVAVFALGWFDQWGAAMVVFILAILSDACDGIAARRWPPKDRWYRRNPHDFDNAADSLLFFAAMIALTIKVFPLWLIVTLVSAVGSVVFLFLIAKMRPSIAEKLDVVFGWCFGTLLFAMLCQITLLAFSNAWGGYLCAIYLLAVPFLVYFKWDRITSRPEVIYTGTW